MPDFVSVGPLMDGGERRPPPCDIEAEQRLLGTLLVIPETYGKVSSFLRPEHFFNPLHGRVYEAIGTLIGEGVTPDPVTVKNKLGEEPVLVPLGGTAEFVKRLMLAQGLPSNAENYGKTIAGHGDRRTIIQVASDAVNAALNPTIPIGNIIAHLEKELRRVQDNAPCGLTITRASDLAGKPVPERVSIVPEWIPSRQVTLLSGDGGVGKSLLAMQLQIAAACGRKWLGLPVVPCRSLGMYAEDDEDELHRRTAALAEVMGVDLDVLDTMAWHCAVEDDAELIEPDERGTVRPTEYFHKIEREAVKFGARLLVIDAVTNFYGADEIQRRQVNAFLRLLRKLALKINGAVILLAHPSLAGMASGSGLSGSTHWNNAVRSRLYFTASTDEGANPDERVLTKLKANYSSKGDMLRLRWQRGGFMPADAPSSIDRVALNAKADRVFRALLAATYADGAWTSPDISARNYAPSIFAKRPDREGLGKPAFEEAMLRLRQAGTVTTETYGKASHIYTRLALG